METRNRAFTPLANRRFCPDKCLEQESGFKLLRHLSRPRENALRSRIDHDGWPRGLGWAGLGGAGRAEWFTKTRPCARHSMRTRYADVRPSAQGRAQRECERDRERAPCYTAAAAYTFAHRQAKVATQPWTPPPPRPHTLRRLWAIAGGRRTKRACEGGGGRARGEEDCGRAPDAPLVDLHDLRAWTGRPRVRLTRWPACAPHGVRTPLVAAAYSTRVTRIPLLQARAVRGGSSAF